MRVSSSVGAQRGLQPHRALARILTIWHVLLAPGKLSYLPVSTFPRFFPSLGICSCCLLPLILVQPPSSLVTFPVHPRKWSRPLCIFSALYLHVFIVLIMSWLVFRLFMYLIFSIAKALREQGPYHSYICFL